jgi:hypothetical protein
VRAVVGGGDPARLRRKLEEAVEGATAVLSFGIAGGLDTALESGALVVATRVRAPGGAWPADTVWSSALVRASGARLGVVAGANAIVAGPDAKRSLRLMTGALVVDLESAVAAAFAASRGLPFAVLRAVADTAEEVLPRAAAVGLTRTGRPAPGRVAWRCCGARTSSRRWCRWRSAAARRWKRSPGRHGTCRGREGRAPSGQRHGLGRGRQPFAFWYSFCAISRISWGW